MTFNENANTRPAALGLRLVSSSVIRAHCRTIILWMDTILGNYRQCPMAVRSFGKYPRPKRVERKFSTRDVYSLN